MPALKPWYRAVTPREDLREGKPLDTSEFAVHFDHGPGQRLGWLAQPLSVLSPSGTEEKRWVDSVLSRKKGLGF